MKHSSILVAAAFTTVTLAFLTAPPTARAGEGESGGVGYGAYDPSRPIEYVVIDGKNYSIQLVEPVRRIDRGQPLQIDHDGGWSDDITSVVDYQRGSSVSILWEANDAFD